jgi:hypothetical protein
LNPRKGCLRECNERRGAQQDNLRTWRIHWCSVAMRKSGLVQSRIKAVKDGWSNQRVKGFQYAFSTARTVGTTGISISDVSFGIRIKNLKPSDFGTDCRCFRTLILVSTWPSNCWHLGTDLASRHLIVLGQLRAGHSINPVSESLHFISIMWINLILAKSAVENIICCFRTLNSPSFQHLGQFHMSEQLLTWWNRLGNLSGEQKSRVAFAVSVEFCMVWYGWTGESFGRKTVSTINALLTFERSFVVCRWSHLFCQFVVLYQVAAVWWKECSGAGWRCKKVILH